jgi:hypothetical protein
MSYLDDTVPADTEAAKSGALRIRQLKTSLIALIAQVWDDTGTFLAKWVTGTLIANDSTDDSARAISSDHIKNNAVITRTMPDGVLSADTTGRAKMADGFLTSAKVDPAFVVPDGSVGTTQLASGGVTTDKLPDSAVTIAKVASGVAKIAVGTYAGSNSASAVVTLGWEPDFVLLSAGTTASSDVNTLNTILGIAFRSEAVSNVSLIHTTGMQSEYTFSTSKTWPVYYAAALQWNSTGFTVVTDSFPFNKSGVTHSYIALKM